MVDSYRERKKRELDSKRPAIFRGYAPNGDMRLREFLREECPHFSNISWSIVREIGNGPRVVITPVAKREYVIDGRMPRSGNFNCNPWGRTFTAVGAFIYSEQKQTQNENRPRYTRITYSGGRLAVVYDKHLTVEANGNVDVLRVNLAAISSRQHLSHEVANAVELGEITPKFSSYAEFFWDSLAVTAMGYKDQLMITGEILPSNPWAPPPPRVLEVKMGWLANFLPTV